MSTFKITKIDKELGHVSVVYSVDGVEQTMCDCPLDSEEDTMAFLEDYGNRYEAAKAQEVLDNAVPKTVTDLVGKTFDVPIVTPDTTVVDPAVE